MYPEVAPFRVREPNWDDYRIFGTVAKERSLGRAAKALGVAKPTIRRRIASLESSIGTSLVDRSANGVALTKQGRQVADMVEAMAMIADGVVHSALPRTVRGLVSARRRPPGGSAGQ
jgi:DNA-binding transcriptional LysR family regulator